MKKLTYLFLAILIVACSGDDSSDSNQLLLEKYDSVVWESFDDKIDNESDRIDIVNDEEERLNSAPGVCRKIVCTRKPDDELGSTTRICNVDCKSLFLSECITGGNEDCCDFVTDNNTMIKPTYN